MTRWLVPTGLFTLIGIGGLWVARPRWGWISENPPMYVSGTVDEPAIAGSIIMFVLYAAVVIVAATVGARNRTVPLTLLTVALGLAFAIIFLGEISGAFPLPERTAYEGF